MMAGAGAVVHPDARPGASLFPSSDSRTQIFHLSSAPAGGRPAGNPSAPGRVYLETGPQRPARER
jgi:hypothetical protein